MDFDFGEISSGTDLSAIHEPAALFDALPSKQQGLGYLRQVQAIVLERWSARRDETDLVVKMNTGTGKTIVGLLILQVSLHDGAGPALFLAPNPQLAERAVVEARRLGLTVVTDPANGKFRSCDAICITSLRVMFNGKTRFGLSDSESPMQVGSVVIDDAHSAITRLEEYSRVMIPPTDAAYEPLMQLFEDDLNAQSAATVMDIKAGERGAVMRIPFWAWQDKAAEVLKVLHPLRTTPTLEWVWPLIKDHLAACEATLTSDGIQISPPLPPTQKFPSFVDAKRRIYMTATLANDSALVTHFAADASTVARPVVPDSAADLGDRLVLVPQELVPDLSDYELRTAIASIAVTDNVVVLVPSWPRAREWSEVANETVSTSGDISAAVTRLQAGSVGLVVVVNQYDGIDLPDNACRVLVIDGLPQAASGSERREATALRESNTIITRQVQRFEQGMGRGVRSREDRCAVLVMDRRLVELISRPDVPSRLSPGTRAQLGLSRKVARSLEGRPDVTMAGVVDLIRKVVDGAEDFRAAARNALVSVTYETVPLTPAAVHQREAYDAAVRGDYEAAANAADAAVNAARGVMKDDRLGGWLAEKAAAYRHATDPARAQAVLAGATAYNSSILRPMSGLAFKPSRPTRRQAEAATQYLADRYTDGARLRVGVEALIADLAWDPGRTEEAEQAWTDLANHVGFSGQRPEKQIGRGSDVLWSDSDGNHLVIEVKSGAEVPLISKRDINQLGGSLRWAEQTLTGVTRIVPVIVHPSRTVERTGTPPAGTRCVDTESHSKLMASIRAYATALATDGQFRDPRAVQKQLVHLHLNGPEFATRYGAAVRVESS
ncbi:helicase C-terminal domain-containing protein [Solwaraspora sp. WMMD406]|uniref:helicase C-terminal domain-containing protein n=1 Tax=Solwaraspora sp. WMMD406 TaxID=3016095 RepID=UPI002415B0B7|nr:helicase C-terminal domain-containing protein [Solwaraspora sp. WMMD406]MDG4764506.1 helicase C-terminal domain-containing protein [Solwaraspora sp. WMMD406]